MKHNIQTKLRRFAAVMQRSLMEKAEKSSQDAREDNVMYKMSYIKALARGESLRVQKNG